MSTRRAAAVVLLATARAALPGQFDVGPADSTSPLIQSLVSDDTARFEQLLAVGADVNVLDVITPLYAAQEYVRNSRQRHAALRRLLRAGAMADGTTQDGSTTLMLAAYHGDVRSAQLLLDHGANPLRENMQGFHAIDAAHKGGHDELGAMLREHLGESGVRVMAERRSKEEL